MIVKPRLLEQGEVILNPSKGQISQKQAGQDDPQHEEQDDPPAFFGGNSQTRRKLREGNHLNDLAPNPWVCDFKFPMLAIILEEDFSQYKPPWESKKIIEGEKSGSMKLGWFLCEDCVKELGVRPGKNWFSEGSQLSHKMLLGWGQCPKVYIMYKILCGASLQRRMWWKRDEAP